MKTRGYLLGGVNGVGKSHIFHNIHNSAPHIQLFHTARELMLWLGLNDTDYSQLRKIDETIKNQETGHLIEHKLRQTNQETVIFDFHYLNLVDGIFKPTIEGDWPSMLSGAILVEAQLNTIYARIEGDDRNRKLFPETKTLNIAEQKNLLDIFLKKTRSAFYETVNKFSIPHLIVENEDMKHPHEDVINFLKESV